MSPHYNPRVKIAGPYEGIGKTECRNTNSYHCLLVHNDSIK